MSQNTLPGSALLPSIGIWTAQSARYAALALHLLYPKTRSQRISRRAGRMSPSPLSRFPVWTLANLDTPAVPNSLPALAAAASQPPRNRITLGLGHPSTSSKRATAPVPISPAPASPRSRATLGRGHPSSFPKSRLVSVAVLAPQPTHSRAGLGLGHPSTSTKQPNASVQPIHITFTYPAQPRSRANIGLGHPTSPRRPIAPVGPRPSPSTARSHAHASQTPKPTTCRRVTPTSGSPRCAVKQPGGALPSISAPAQRSMSSESLRAGTTQVQAKSLEGVVENITAKGEEKDVECDIVAAHVEFRGHLAAIGFRTLSDRRVCFLLFFSSSSWTLFLRDHGP
ncbi:hypothetical protein DFH06DRAFT_1476431 [Mycena polygramma]|nr:hypothetical protein DFH06DRAFT_1476431 [Mycena polygramma]